MPKTRYIAASLIATLLLSACGKAEPKTLIYYQHHMDEAREKAARCKAGTDTDTDECQNAGTALLLEVKPVAPIGTNHN